MTRISKLASAHSWHWPCGEEAQISAFKRRSIPQQTEVASASGLPGHTLRALAQPCDSQSWEGKSLQDKQGCA